MSRLVVVVGVALVVSGLGWWSCAKGDSGVADDGGAFQLDSGTPCNTHCSADLHAVVDCNNQVIEECPADQGCSINGGCVSACQSASENKSTFGCEFFSVTPPAREDSRGSCYAVMIANTWNSAVTITAEYHGQTIDVSSFMYMPQGSGSALTYQLLPSAQIAAGDVGILFLSKYESGGFHQVDCPVPQALEMPTHFFTTGRGWAFHIATDRPVVAYDAYPWGGAESFVPTAALLLPTPSWGDNYVTADGWEPWTDGKPFTQVVAAQDGTTVTMVPVANVPGGTAVPAMTANTPATFTLDRGEVVQFLQDERLAGTTLQSDKPISVWGGSSCMKVPLNDCCCDVGHQQLLPVTMLGHEYAAVRYPSRGGNDLAPYTLVGMVDGTQLSYDPLPNGAPASLNRGDVAVFSTDQPFHVASQDNGHPFHLAAYMTGCTVTPSNLGDPEVVGIVPPQQFLSRYVFVTDPSYGHTVLVFVRQQDENGVFQDVDLDCLGPVTGWNPLGAAGTYEYAQVAIMEGGLPQGNCDNGRHVADSSVPFGLTVWGYDQCASYGYPAGMSVEPINQVIVPPVM